jgi:predicted TIM-barrel fold metal-dependent hydrolase
MISSRAGVPEPTVTDRVEGRSGPGASSPPRVDVHVHPTEFSAHGPAFAARNRLDYSWSGLLREMDGHRIGWAVFLAPRLAPSPERALEEGTRVSRASGGRLLLTGTVDPTLGAESVEQTIRLWESNPEPLRAVKLYPGYRPFSVTDERLGPVFEWAARRQRPVFVHQGDTSDPDGLVKFARPIDLDEVAVAHRDVKFVLCHLGNPWVEEAAEVIYKNANVWGDTSGLLNPFAPYHAQMVERMRARLAHAIATIGDPSKLLFGSDWPISSLADALSLVEPLDLPAGDRARILGDNARALLDLPAPTSPTGGPDGDP